MNVTQRMMPTSPLARKQAPSLPHPVTATPPPNRNLARQLKLKGSYTDPAQTRRREAFGVVSQTLINLRTSISILVGIKYVPHNEQQSRYLPGLVRH